MLKHFVVFVFTTVQIQAICQSNVLCHFNDDIEVSLPSKLSLVQVVTPAGNVDGKLASFVMSYVIVTNWVILQVSLRTLSYMKEIDFHIVFNVLLTGFCCLQVSVAILLESFVTVSG
jgi:hypothetical protein